MAGQNIHKALLLGTPKHRRRVGVCDVSVQCVRVKLGENIPAHQIGRFLTGKQGKFARLARNKLTGSIVETVVLSKKPKFHRPFSSEWLQSLSAKSQTGWYKYLIHYKPDGQLKAEKCFKYILCLRFQVTRAFPQEGNM